MQEIENPSALHPKPEADPFTRHQAEIRREEEHELRVARRPSVRVAGFEQRAGLRSSLLNGCLDELVDDLRDHETYTEEDPLKLTPEEEMRDESSEADEDRDERDPGEEMSELIAATVPDVCESYGFELVR